MPDMPPFLHSQIALCYSCSNRHMPSHTRTAPHIALNWGQPILFWQSCQMLPGPKPGHIASLGDQLAQGPVLLDLGGNPLGFAGTRQVGR